MKTKLKAFFAAIILLSAVAAQASADTGFQAGVNMDFLFYQYAFLSPGFAVMPQLAPGMELTMGMAFGIFVHPVTITNPLGVSTTTSLPSFQIPIKIGFNFLFPVDEIIEPYLGIGILPQFSWTDQVNNSFLFLIGPYLGGGVRFKIHPLMSIYVELEQPLLIGNPPAWLNTSTRIGAGLKFNIPDAKPAAGAK